MSSVTYGEHLIGQTISGTCFEGGGQSVVRFRWGLWNADGKPVENTGGIGVCVAGDDIWACAAECARLARAMVTDWRNPSKPGPHATLFSTLEVPS